MMLVPTLASAQVDTAGLKRYLYRNGKVLGQLPYGRAFLLVGKTQQPGTTQAANVVEMLIYEEKNRENRIRQQRRVFFKPDSITISFSERIYHSGYWWQPDQNNPSLNFELYVGRPLKINTYYRIVLNFYQRYTVDDQTTRQLVESVKLSIYEEGNASVRVEDVEQALNDAVKAYAKETKFGYLQPSGNDQLTFDQSERRLSIPTQGELPINLQLELGKLIQQEQILLDANNKLNAQQAEVKDFARRDTFNDLIFLLRNILLTDTLAVPYRLSDVLALEAFARDGILKPNPFPNLLRFAESSDGQRLLSPLQQNVLLALNINYYEPIRDLSRQRDVLVDQIQIRNERIGNGGLDQLIAEGFVRANSAELIQTPFSGQEGQGESDPDGSGRRQSFTIEEGQNSFSSTGYNAINIGTAYGASLVFLNPPDPTAFDSADPFAQMELNLITYLGAKFYFSKVDKALFIQDPYPLIRDRFSLLVGARATGRLNYRGATFGNVIGVQPIVGLSFDLNRALSLDAGMVLFSEESLSPLNSLSRVRTAPFIGISLDANAFNGVKNLLTGTNLLPQ